MLTKIKDIASWVNDSSVDENEQRRREAMHILLYAIGSSDVLSVKMAMKGGVLLGISYRSSRYTYDIDFSTSEKAAAFEIEEFKDELDKQLIYASEKLPYGMTCLIQKFKKEPNNPEATFPTFKLTVGYAYKTDRTKFKRLQSKNSSDVIKIDYSLNEMIQETELLEVGDGKTISAYSYYDLIAEKYRAILQQEQRNRYRSQDVYDIHYVLTNAELPDDQDKNTILKTLLKKSTSRNLEIDRLSIRSPEIKRRSKVKYEKLQQAVYGELPEFETAYKFVQDFYESLPWEK